MSASIDRPATVDALFLWVMHRFADEFHDHANLRGGMALRLIDSPRSTTDIDYVFAPFTSKKDIRTRVSLALRSLEGADVQISLHSKMLRAEVRLDDAAIQVEVSVASECHGVPMSTGGFARQLGQPARVIRIMSPEWSFAHKLAAWNERRLTRDLYDCYFFSSRLGVTLAIDVLDRRLADVVSRIPALAGRKTTSHAGLASDLRAEAASLTQDRVDAELGGLLPVAETAGLALRIKAATIRLAEWLEGRSIET